MKLKDLLEKYGEYEVSETKGDWCDAGHITLEINKPKPNSIWELKNGDWYYCINVKGEVMSDVWREVVYPEREVGNAFLTEKDALKDTERRKVETLLLKHGGRRWFDGYNHNFHIGLDEYEEHLKAYILMTPTQGTIYFDTGARAQKAISEIGEQRIIKALFEVR